MFPNNLPDLGDVLEVHAFDIPEDRLLEVSQQLNGMLAAMRLTPMAIGMAFFEGESAQAESKVPSNAVWLRPEHRLTSVSTPALTFPVPASFPKLVGAGGAASPLLWSGTVVCEPMVSESVAVGNVGIPSLAPWPHKGAVPGQAGPEPSRSSRLSVGAGIPTGYSLAS
jgi:hypothetical protein